MVVAGGSSEPRGSSTHKLTRMLTRREFIRCATELGVILSLPWPLSVAAAPGAGLEGAGLGKGQWETIAEVQRYLFPTEPQSPGAFEINAAPYLFFVLSDQKLDAGERTSIPAGLVQFESLVQARYGKQFPALTEVQHEQVLREFETSAPGREWITRLLGYILEALLTDPVYGGNPGGIGWQWLGHRPGFPRPPSSNVYGLL